MAKTKIPGEYLKDSVVRFTAKAGENITKGQAVYISGISGEVPVVSLADANDTAKMPAFGLAEATVSTNAEVEITSFGTLKGLDTSSYSLGDILYVDTTAGALTNNPSGLEATKLQNIGMVQRVHASSGSIKVGGAGRTNAVPNLDDGDIFIGDSNNKAISSSFTAVLNSEAGINSSADATAITIDSSENVGIGNSNPDTKLTVGTFGNTARAAAFNGGSILIDGGAASEIIIGDGNVAYMSIQTTDNATAMKIRNFSGNSDLVTIERATGNVGIGGTPTNYSDHKTLSLYGNTGTGAGFIEFNDTSGNADAVIFSDDGNLFINADYDNTAASSSIRFRVDGSSEKMRIDSSGNVAIGSISDALANMSGLFRILDSTGGDRTVAHFGAHNYGDTGKTFINIGTEYGDGTSRIGSFNDTGNSSVLVFETHSTTSGAFNERMRIKSDGQITTQGDILPGADVIMANGRGISFAATSNSSGSMSSELLDDYEEGTWTPACGATLTVATGHYTKIGNQVTVHYRILTTGGLPTSTSQVQISGLPFTIDSNGAGSIYARYYTPNDSTLTTVLNDGDTVIRLININEQSFDYTMWGELEASANNSVDIRGTATYKV